MSHPASFKQLHVEPERLIGLDLMRATEAAALHSYRWIGKGEKEMADAAATDAIRGMLNLVDMRGVCTIGEGIKDEAPGIFVGEQLGQWRDGGPHVCIAVDPIDGTTLTAKGLPGAIAVLAGAKTSAPDHNALAQIPSVYMMKLAYGPQVSDGAGTMRLDAPVNHNLEVVALTLNKRVRDLVVCVLDRPRHEKLIADIRATGASIRMIGDGDVAGAIAPSLPDSGVDLFMGVGGAPEAVLAAAGIKCLGGGMLTRMWPRDDAERAEIMSGPHAADIERVYTHDDLASGDEIMFVATGVTESPLLRGVRVSGKYVMTHSVVMRATSHTVRFVKAFHDLRHKTIKLHSSDGATML